MNSDFENLNKIIVREQIKIPPSFERGIWYSFNNYPSVTLTSVD